MASPALVVGMQDNEYTDAQVGDAGGLFKSLDPAPCGAVPVYLIHCSSSSLPHPMFQFQSTSSNVPVPVYLIQCSSSSLPHPMFQFQSTSSRQCSSSSLPHPVLQFQSTSSSAPVPVYLIHAVLQFQSTSSIAPVPVQCSGSSLPHHY